MKIITEKIELPVHGQELFLPFNNLWNCNIYRTTQPFKLSPTFIRANSTSGSPVILGDDFFVGCLNPHADALFKSNGKTLSCIPAENQIFFYGEGNPFRLWREYNEYVYGQLTQKSDSGIPSLHEIEYCTWVEQKKFAVKYFNDASVAGAVNALCNKFIDDYLHRIDKMNFPRGTFTLDHGWALNSEKFNFGLPQPDKKKFKDFPSTVDRIRNAGFIPGLWFAPAFMPPESQLFSDCPEIKGEKFTGANEGGFDFPLFYLDITSETETTAFLWFKKIFAPYIEMGIRKLKIDFTYNNKSMMIKILELLYKAVKELNPEVEVEGHIPDIFASRYLDAVRLNDLVIETNPEWERLFEDHYTVCRNSAYKTQLNLDHIGTNSPDVSESNFLKSLSHFKGKAGYPVISLLPDIFSDKTVDATRQYLGNMQA